MTENFVLNKLSLQKNLLFVQIDRTDSKNKEGSLAVIDIATSKIIKIIPLPGEHPDLNMDFDELRQKLWVTCIGSPNKNNGSQNRIDLNPQSDKYLSVDYTYKNPAFEGTLALGNKFDSVFYVEHTATPTESTHFFHRNFGPDGTLENLVIKPSDIEDKTSAFERSDTLQMSANRKLAAISFNCEFFACPRGGGLYFFDGTTGATYQKLFAAGKIAADVAPPPAVTIPFLVSGFAFLRP